MYGPRLVSGLAAVFAGTAVLFAVLAVAYNLVFFAVAALFGAVAYFMWYHASGKFARRLYRGVERHADPGRERRRSERDRRRTDQERRGFDRERGGFGAGPREEWVPPRDERARRRAENADGRRTAGERGRRRRRRQRPGGAVGSSGPTAREAYRVLGLDPGAEEGAVRDAYRERVKEVHPDSPTGDEEEFKRVTAAYERLTDD